MQRAIRSLPSLQTLKHYSAIFSMEYQILFSLLLSFLIFMLMILRVGKRSKTNLPPGPTKLPFIGSLHQFVGSMPHHCLAKLAQKYGPIMHLKLGEVSIIVVSSPEVAKEVLHTQGTIFADRPFSLAASILCYNSSDLAFARYGDYWRQMRKICTLELFSAKRVKSFRSIREEEVSDFVKSISSTAGLVVNLSEKIFALTYGITARVVFSKKLKSQEELLLTLQETGAVSGGLSFAEFFPSITWLQLVTGVGPQLKRLHGKVDRMVENIMDEHRAKKGEPAAVQGLLDVLLDLQEQSNLQFPLTNDHIKATIMEIFFAGSETSSTVVDWAMSEMVRNPEILRKAQAEVREVFEKRGKVDEEGLNELKFLKLVVKETLRLHPPAVLSIPRESTEKCQVFGFDIPAETKVIVNLWAIGRDPKYWKEAERFWPERFIDNPVDYKGGNFQFIPFGAGKRICPGISFATPNMELPLAEMLFYFNWKVPSGGKPQDLDMTELRGASVRRKNDLCLIPIPYQVLLPVGQKPEEL